MQVELVRVTTRDGVRLDGALRAATLERSELAVDAILCLHGTGGNFYGSTLFDAIAQRVGAQGVTTLRVNTRGHDGISTAVTPHGGRRLGAAFEAVDDCRRDLSAWIGLLRDRGYDRIGLVGHSLGAVKSVYASAHDPKPAVERLVAISPPRLCYSWFLEGSGAEQFAGTYELARRRVDDGDSESLIDVTFPLPMIISAAGYLEKYGPDERFDVLRYVSRVACPMLFTFGSLELSRHVAFGGLPERLADLHSASGAPTVEVIPDADHFYTGAHDALCDRLIAWLGSESAR